MKTITFRADREFDTLLTRLARRTKTSRSGVIREAVRHYERELEREALREQLPGASLKVRAQAVQAADDFDAASSDGL